MRICRYLTIVLLALSTSCTSCQDEILKYVEAIGKVKMVKKRMSGINYLDFDKQDSRDGYVAKNGFLCVQHDPGCGWWGNNGSDKFFGTGKVLPAGLRVLGASYTNFWPSNVYVDSFAGWGTGSYGAKLEGGGSYPFNVNWYNTCWSAYGGKSVHYAITFEVEMPEGTDIGEETFDPSEPATSTVCLPDGYLPNKPTSESSTSRCSTTRTASYGLELHWNGNTGGPLIYSAVFPSTPFSCQAGKLLKLTNSNVFPLIVSGNGNNLTLNQAQSTTSTDLNSLYGSASPELPLTISVSPVTATHIDPSTVRAIYIGVDYEYSE